MRKETVDFGKPIKDNLKSVLSMRKGTATVGQKIRKYRLQRGLTIEELGKISGIHPVAVNLYEIDKRKPGIENVAKLARALKIRTDDLIGEEA